MNWRWYRKSSICECDDVSFHCIGNGKSRLITHSYCAYEWNSVLILECYLDLIWYVLQVSFQILVQGILKYTNTKVDSFIQNNSSCCFCIFMHPEKFASGHIFGFVKVCEDLAPVLRKQQRNRTRDADWPRSSVPQASLALRARDHWRTTGSSRWYLFRNLESCWRTSINRTD